MIRRTSGSAIPNAVVHATLMFTVEPVASLRISAIVNSCFGIVNTRFGDRERSEATPGVQASSWTFSFLQDGPDRTMRRALWSSRSQIASATVASPR